MTLLTYPPLGETLTLSNIRDLGAIFSHVYNSLYNILHRLLWHSGMFGVVFTFRNGVCLCLTDSNPFFDVFVS